MPPIEMVDIGTETTALGFGCAGIFQVPDKSQRRNLLEVAYEAGIRHFDVAPMYGLGRAESELAPFLAGKRDSVSVTTKFGISPSSVGKMFGVVQGPIRSLMAKRPAASAKVKASGTSPKSGLAGKLLYDVDGYTVGAAKRSLHRSLKALRTEYVDAFLLHDPELLPYAIEGELVDFLDEQVKAGKIRKWGITNNTSEPSSLLKIAPLGQFRDDLLSGSLDGYGWLPKARVTFGIFERSLPILRSHFEENPADQVVWRDQLGLDPLAAEDLATVVLRSSMRRNPMGVVLVSSRRPSRIRALAQAASAGVTSESEERLVAGAVAGARRLLPEGGPRQ